MASRAWQYHVNHKINNKLLFVRLVQITLVVDAEISRGAKASLKALLVMGRGAWVDVYSPVAGVVDERCEEVGSWVIVGENASYCVDTVLVLFLGSYMNKMN